jgi:uncharacterized protein
VHHQDRQIGIRMVQGTTGCVLEGLSIYADINETDHTDMKMKKEHYIGKENENKLVKRLVRCPTCKQEVPFDGNPYRPFCSRGCKGLDLIGWARESYRIEGRPDEDTNNEKSE